MLRDLKPQRAQMKKRVRDNMCHRKDRGCYLDTHTHPPSDLWFPGILFYCFPLSHALSSVMVKAALYRPVRITRKSNKVMATGGN